MKVDELLYFIKPKIFKTHSLPKRLIINLTSYPKRYSILHLSIKSLLNQSIIPEKVILWLWRGDQESLPAKIRELEGEGLEIRLLEEDWKSFNKSFLQMISNEIVNSIRGINRVVYDVTSKPPSTIELE